jgi:hypothetical protein
MASVGCRDDYRITDYSEMKMVWIEYNDNCKFSEMESFVPNIGMITGLQITEVF